MVITVTTKSGRRRRRVEIHEENIFEFPQGLVGCEDWKRFALIEEPDEPVSLLQCLDHLETCFLVTDPLKVCPNYQWDWPLEGPSFPAPLDPADLMVLCTLGVSEDGQRVTANLLGPLVIDRRRRIGVQLVLADSDYSTRYPVVSAPPA